ncbi:MAG: paraquat-inducible protein A [Bdellovibrionales bacterium]
MRRVRSRPFDSALACAIAGIFFYVVALTAPFLEARLYGGFRVSNLSSGLFALDNENIWGLAAVVALTTVVMPLIKLLGLFIVLVALRLERPPHWIAHLFGWLKHLNTWTMIEVFMLGFLVAYMRLEAIMQVDIGIAVYALAGVMVAMAGIDAALDPEAVWEEMERRQVVKTANGTGRELLGCDVCHKVSCGCPHDDCPRCGAELYARKPDSFNRAWAFTVAAAILYIPSNWFPVMTVSKFGKVQSYTIFGGLREFVHVGLWPLALLVFVASIAIPLFKLVSIAYMLIETHRGSAAHLRGRTRLYRIVDFIGRWSMVDIFMVSILVALVHFGVFVQITANVGAMYFGSVVVLTMLAVASFDPRFMWDAASARAPRRAAVAA